MTPSCHIQIQLVQTILIQKEALQMNDQTKIELEAAAFRGLVTHLQKRTDAQNIDIMKKSLNT